jgi:hypothetical protein
MILRSITKHVRDQNWFAVGIDFLIVIVGVFIGIQVANWNDAQRERVRAADYAQSLKLDLRAELEYSEGLIDYYRTTLSSGEIAYAGLTQAGGHSDEVVLIHAYRASQFNFYERRRSTFDEIVNAGMLNLITDSELREVAILIYATQVFDIVQEEGQNSRFRELFRMTVELSLQRHLGQQCGDRLVESRNGAAGLLSLDYACELTASATNVAAAVAALREDNDVIRALRLRNVQVAGRISDLELTIQTLGLTGLFSDRETPA